MLALKGQGFEDLYGELLVINGDEVDFIEPKLVEYDSDYYELDKKVAKRVMSGIGMVSEYFSRRLYQADVEIWEMMLNKKLDDEGGKYYLEELNLVATDAIISAYRDEEEYDFKRLVNKIISDPKNKFFEVNNFNLDVLIDSFPKVLVVSTHPNFDVKLYTGIMDEDNLKLYLNYKPVYKEDIKKEDDLDFFNISFDSYIGEIDVDGLLSFYEEEYSTSISLEELFSLLENVNLLPDKVEDIEGFSEKEKEVSEEVIDYIDDNYGSYDIAKDMYFIKRAITFTDYTAGDILNFYTRLLMDEDSNKVTIKNILDLSEKISNSNLHYKHLSILDDKDF